MPFARPSRIILALAAIVLGSTACASGGSGTSGTAARRGSSTRIVQEELVALDQLSAYAAIQRLRPTWFRTRTGALPQVHIDGTPQAGGVEALRNLPASEVEEMVYMNAADATTRFGTNYVSGVILVTRRTGR